MEIFEKNCQKNKSEGSRSSFVNLVHWWSRTSTRLLNCLKIENILSKKRVQWQTKGRIYCNGIFVLQSFEEYSINSRKLCQILIFDKFHTVGFERMHHAISSLSLSSTLCAWIIFYSFGTGEHNHEEQEQNEMSFLLYISSLLSFFLILFYSFRK